jgi:beta-1,4-mannooligosaccharide phosphorylase
MEVLWLILPFFILFVLYFAGVLTAHTEKDLLVQDAPEIAVAPPEKVGPMLARSLKNPLITPHPHNDWETHAVFNPAVVVVDGVVHLLYRAMGADGVSRVGYASSADGVHFKRHYNRPVFVPKEGLGFPLRKHIISRKYNRKKNPSGGGWAGCEDPRIVQIDDIRRIRWVGVHPHGNDESRA